MLKHHNINAIISMFHKQVKCYNYKNFKYNYRIPLIVAPPLIVALPYFWDLETYYVSNLLKFLFSSIIQYLFA